jgi:DNA polymerase-1
LTPTAGSPVRSFTPTLGGRPVTVHAPEAGDFSDAAFWGTFGANGLYGLDVESTYLTELAQFDPDFRVRLVQFATVDVAWVLSLHDGAQLEAARRLLSDPTAQFCSHTNMDVLSVATTLGVDITGRNLDTRSLAIMADPDKDQDRDLKTLTTAHIGPELAEADAELYARFLELWPGRKNAAKAAVEAHGWEAIDIDDPAYLTYAGLDAIACRRLAEVLVPLTQAPLELLRMESWLATQANRIQLRGLRVDVEALAALKAEAEGECGQAKEDFGALTGVNVQSPVKINEWFAEHGADWEVWPGPRTPTGSPSLAKEAVHLVGGYPLDSMAETALAHLVRFKGHLDLLNKTNGIAKVLDPAGRIHPVLHPMGASTTARMSSAGPNVQNFSKRDPRMRGLFLPEPGHVLATIDFDQVELRVVAALAREEKMIETILAGGDLHQLTVDEIAQAGIDIDRDTGKMTNFLIVYGGGGTALHEQGGIPLGQAGEIVATWRDRYPSIKALAEYMGGFRDEVRTISNRRLPVTVNRKDGTTRAYANINYYVQSSARELLVDAWHRFAEEFGHADKVWYPVHDELILHIREDEVEQVIADAQRCMNFEFRGVPISATAVVLRDEDGVSRWMTSKRAEKIKAGVAA